MIEVKNVSKTFGDNFDCGSLSCALIESVRADVN